MSGAADTYRSIRERGGVIDLSSRLLLRFTGDDRVRYLNGQVSNDVRKLQPGQTMHACVMTAKGRMSGDVFIAATKDALRVDAAPSLADSLPMRFERYIVADDVTLEEADGEGLLHVIGGDAEELQRDGIGSAAANRYGAPGIDLFGPRDAIAALQRELTEIFPEIDETMLETLRIEAGIPKWGAELDESTIPVEAGLQHDAISYEKGCYIGQEVISRLKSIGHVNRTLRGLVAVDGESPLQAGATLFVPAAPDRPVGTLTSVAYSFALDRPVALGYVRRGTDSALLTARDADGENMRAVEVRDLPLIP